MSTYISIRQADNQLKYKKKQLPFPFSDSTEKLGYSEQWITDFVYNVVLLAKEDQKKELKRSKEA